MAGNYILIESCGICQTHADVEVGMKGEQEGNLSLQLWDFLQAMMKPSYDLSDFVFITLLL